MTTWPEFLADPWSERYDRAVILAEKRAEYVPEPVDPFVAEIREFQAAKRRLSLLSSEMDACDASSARRGAVPGASHGQGGPTGHPSDSVPANRLTGRAA